MGAMATTEARPAQLPPPLLRARSLELRTAPPAVLGAALAVAAVYAAFANGAIGIPDETRLQVGGAGGAPGASGARGWGGRGPRPPRRPRCFPAARWGRARPPPPTPGSPCSA